MNTYKADLHIHTVLSPCGDLEMSPINIVKAACEKGLDIIGVTDHNSTLHCKVISEIAAKYGLFVMMGAEVTTQEEVHCLAFFENLIQLSEFQKYLELHLPAIPNDSDKFGYQLLVNEEEEVIDEIEPLLISAINQNINQVEQKVHELDGLFILAHIDKSRYSILSQLGFIPPDLKIDALEISPNYKINTPASKVIQKATVPIITNSDAHFIEQIGIVTTSIELAHRNFSEIRKAFQSIDGRKILSL